MARSECRLIQKLAALVVSGLLLLVLAGCPNPNMHLWFEEGSHFHKSHKERVGELPITVFVRSFSMVGSDRYWLSLTIKLKGTEKVEGLSFDQNAVQVLANNHEMKVEPVDSVRIQGNLRDGDYKIEIAFMSSFADLGIVQEETSTVASPFSVTIYLDKALFWRGNPVSIRPIRAVERQPPK